MSELSINPTITVLFDKLNLSTDSAVSNSTSTKTLSTTSQQTEISVDAETNHFLMLKDKTFTLTQYAKEFKETHLQLKEAILKWVVQEHLGQWEENIEDIIPIKWQLIKQIK